mmetsp:Transcript_9028/g.28656  ORF Transcript_9028/g.28656 Transcript_9028/m.28656 type:complete len:461 (+) Transcript_9028:49-1431(+)
MASLSLLLSLLTATAAATRGEPGFVAGHASGSDVHVAQLTAPGLNGSVVGGGGSGGNQASARKQRMVMPPSPPPSPPLRLVEKLRVASAQRPAHMPTPLSMKRLFESPARPAPSADAAAAAAETDGFKSRLMGRALEAPSLRGRTILLSIDTRALLPAGSAYWARSAYANALYANFHGYDYAYVTLPENGTHFDRHPLPRLPTWCRFVVVAAAAQAGYSWIALLDSDMVVHQPYTPLEELLRFRSRGSRHSLSERAGSIAAIAMDNSWWQHGHPCAGNLLFHNVRSLRLLLSTWWSMDAEYRFGPGGQWGAVGKREQSALWGMLKGHKELRSAIPTLDIMSLWCIPNRTLHRAFEHSAAGKPPHRRGCDHDLEVWGGCSSAFFYCHVRASHASAATVLYLAASTPCPPGAAYPRPIRAPAPRRHRERPDGARIRHLLRGGSDGGGSSSAGLPCGRAHPLL